MKLYEYESKQIFAKYGIPVPRGFVLERGQSIKELMEKHGIKPPVAIKSQVLVGGRGKAGGIKIARSVEEAEKIAEELFNKPIKGLLPRVLLVEEAVEHEAELYASITMDRARRRPVVLVSRLGGVDIEEIAKEHPEEIHRAYVDPWIGLRGYMARRLGKSLGLSGKRLQLFEKILLAMYNVFVDYDGDLVEINPLAVTSDGLVALDAKIIVDDNALYRHPEIAQRDPAETGEYTELEAKARRLGFAFVELDGDVGIIGNGAGLTMATMDLVYERGGKPANFLDIGGGASAERVKQALEILYEYPKAKVIFMNIFGGITRCDEVARGIVAAIKELGFKKPIVVRLTGTNEEEGRRILKEAGLEAFIDPIEAADKAIELARR
ncbi:ADP-forming succinate--CoA ligase subunit beta [Pyrofollis japonicus]|uniref:ADP-forming succinate--CoA ligase subunit beta n=1 Tax=Pyrofollis japonicus TaxID=3060460 RepID=UPI00295BCF02|nr:ADP-forming succinate--CoA ligase subunit beta [Pyrofollis japonicus]BEP17405.1 ADP-forming succinate--CoA ligase subunit beta [Pyrofollis japonicus]